MFRCSDFGISVTTNDGVVLELARHMLAFEVQKRATGTCDSYFSKPKDEHREADLIVLLYSYFHDQLAFSTWSDFYHSDAHPKNLLCHSESGDLQILWNDFGSSSGGARKFRFDELRRAVTELWKMASASAQGSGVEPLVNDISMFEEILRSDHT
eukprot:c20009_g5_i1.p1 GENE.c20009_g5_i1~~c20009_g5_i1.p1  ORF type:complete len:155 (+),score=23.43 c20009_g5_i1:474-938(+)